MSAEQRLLALFPGSGRTRRAFFARHHQELQDRNVRVVLGDDDPTDADAEVFDDILKLPRSEEVGEVVWAVSHFARESPLDGILCQTEAAVAAGSLLCERLSLTGGSSQGVYGTISKLETRRRLLGSRVPQPAFALARTAADVHRVALNLGYPLMLKAMASTMGRLVTRIDAQHQVVDRVERFLAGLSESTDVTRLLAFAAEAHIAMDVDPRRDFLVESCIGGEPVEVDGFMVRGEPQCFGVLEQVLTPPPLFFIDGYLLPADRSQQEALVIQTAAEASLRALGLDSSGFSVELRTDGTIAQVIEVNGRLGEDDAFGEFFRTSTGVEPTLAAIDLALGKKIRVEAARRPTALAYQSSFLRAVVSRLPSNVVLNRLTKNDVSLHIAVHVGDELYAPPHPETFPHLAAALATHPHSSRAAFAIASDAVHGIPLEITPRSTPYRHESA